MAHYVHSRASAAPHRVLRSTPMGSLTSAGAPGTPARSTTYGDTWVLRTSPRFRGQDHGDRVTASDTDRPAGRVCGRSGVNRSTEKLGLCATNGELCRSTRTVRGWWLTLR